jgi:hypothetical protein
VPREDAGYSGFFAFNSTYFDWINNSNNSLFNFNNSINDLSTLNGTNPVILNQISISILKRWMISMEIH